MFYKVLKYILSGVLCVVILFAAMMMEPTKEQTVKQTPVQSVPKFNFN